MTQRETRSLHQLLAAWQTAVSHTSHLQPPHYDGPDITLSGLVEHTDHVTAGSCFVARVRTGTDGHRWIGKAIEKGATAILAQKPASELDAAIPANIVYLQVADTAEALAWLAAAWYGFPSQQMIMIGNPLANSNRGIVTVFSLADCIVPAVSTWGLIALGSIVLTAGTVMIRRRRLTISGE